MNAPRNCAGLEILYQLIKLRKTLLFSTMQEKLMHIFSADRTGAIAHLMPYKMGNKNCFTCKVF